MRGENRIMPETVCDNWVVILPIILKDEFIGWGNPTVKKKNCYDYCVKQLNNAGYKLKSPGWGTQQIIAGSIYQTYLASDVGKMKKGYQKDQFDAGVKYLKQALSTSIPVMVGVEHSSGTSSADKVTDHYVVIVGMGSDEKGKFFWFYDNATGIVNDGTSPDNKIYCNCQDSSLIGTGKNSYVLSGYGQYIVTQIRESVANK